jgi:ABC-type multidrug transport system ATPase subunit
MDVTTLVNDIIHELGLDSAADVKIGDVFYKGCSGGQKRRVSIGVELMKQPCAFRVSSW